MNTPARHALLFGATGLVGGLLLEALLTSDGIARVTAITRRPLPRTHAKLANPVSDLADLSVGAHFGDADVAFCCLGTTIRQAGSQAAFRAVDHDLVLRSAQLSKQEGVRHFLAVSAMGASASSPVFYNRVKAETERDLAALGFPRLTIVQPSLLLGHRGGASRPGEAIGIALAPLLGPLLAGPLSPYKPIQAADVAAGMLACALRADGEKVERLRWRDIMQLAGKA